MLSCLFGFTNGLALDCAGNGELCYLHDFNDIASDDDLVIYVGIVLGAIGTAWGLLHLKRAPGLGDLAVYAALLLFQALWLALAEAAPITWTIADTIMLDRNAVLLFWVLSYSMLWVMFMLGTIMFTAGAVVALLRPQPVQAEYDPGQEN